MSELLNATKAYADFLEALGIIEDWQSKASKENPKLTRLAELMLKILDRHQDLAIEIKDLKLMNTLIRDEKNRIIQELKQQ